MAAIDAQLNVIEQDLSNNLNEDYQLLKKKQDARDKLMAAISNEKDAPILRKKAEVDYSMAANPKNPEGVMRSFYKTEADTIKEKLLKRAREKINQTKSTIKHVNSQKKIIQANKKMNVTEGFQDEELTIGTLYRKKELYVEHHKTLSLWIDLMNCIILAYAFVMVYDLRSNLLHPVVSLTILATFASVFILEPIIYFVYLIPSFVIQHLGWGSDRIKNTVWLYLYVPIVALVLYIIIYNLIV